MTSTGDWRQDGKSQNANIELGLFASCEYAGMNHQGVPTPSMNRISCLSGHRVGGFWHLYRGYRVRKVHLEDGTTR